MQAKKEILDECTQTDYFKDRDIEEVETSMQEYANQQSIDFGRWLLANAEVKLDVNDDWIWEYNLSLYNTAEMFEIYLKESES